MYYALVIISTWGSGTASTVIPNYKSVETCEAARLVAAKQATTRHSFCVPMDFRQ